MSLVVELPLQAANDESSCQDFLPAGAFSLCYAASRRCVFRALHLVRLIRQRNSSIGKEQEYSNFENIYWAKSVLARGRGRWMAQPIQFPSDLFQTILIPLKNIFFMSKGHMFRLGEILL